MIGGILQATPLLGGNGLGGILDNLAQLGFFTYALPFLLIFALVFGILMKMNLFKDNTKGIAAIISLAVALMALQFSAVPQFFSQIFPSLGIGLSIILVVLVVVGFFSDPDKPWIKATFFVIAAIVALVVIVSSSGLDVGGWVKNNLGESAGVIIVVAIVGVAVAAILGVFKKNPNKAPAFNPFNPTAFKS